MEKKKIADPVENNPQWYLDVIAEAELVSHSAVKGCMVIRPYGFAIWELVRDQLDFRIKERGVMNTSFPLLIPESFLSRETDHVEGFAPECATVTRVGREELSEPLIIRPTSETIIHDSMAQWINSYRDLPMRLNQWGSVIRWEKRPRFFLRNREFLWHEGHTAHATEQEARQEVEEVVEMYHSYAEEVLAVPSVRGQKTESEKFAGAVQSFSTESFLPNGKGLQIATVHYLGQNFSKMADVKFVDNENKHQYVEMTSWGTSTRLMGALIMTHGDEKGLFLPPAVAPFQVVIVPIGIKKDPEGVKRATEKIAQELRALGVRVKIDNRESMSPGAKFYYWEVRGVPLRLEIGPRDIEAGTVVFAWRNKDDKSVLEMSTLRQIPSMLLDLQKRMLEKARKVADTSTRSTNSYSEFSELVDSHSGFISARWCGSVDCESSVKLETKATIRNIPSEKQGEIGACIYCGKKADHLAYFAKAY